MASSSSLLPVCKRWSWKMFNNLSWSRVQLLRVFFSSSPWQPSLESLSHCQVLTSDKKTIVCVHPAKQTSINQTQPLRPDKPQLRERIKELTSEQVSLIRKLRQEEGSLWTVNTLARFFNVKRSLISEVAPASLGRQDELDKERKRLAAMRPHRRKLYRAQQQLVRQKRLQDVLAQNKYSFPGLKQNT